MATMSDTKKARLALSEAKIKIKEVAGG